MKTRIFLCSLLLALSASAQTLLPARQVSVETNAPAWTNVAPAVATAQAALDWIDANWNWYDGGVDASSWTFLDPTNLTNQGTFDFLDSWFSAFVASTNDGLLKGTNILGATYSTSNKTWTIDPQTAGLLPGTNIFGYSYSTSTLTWTPIEDTNAAVSTNDDWFSAIKTGILQAPSNEFLVVEAYTNASGSTNFSLSTGYFTAASDGQYEFGFGFGLGSISHGVANQSLYVLAEGAVPTTPTNLVAGTAHVATNWFLVSAAGDLTSARYHGGGSLWLTNGQRAHLLAWAGDQGASYTNSDYFGVYFYGHKVSE